jgi:hypothetical protein
MVLIFVKKRKLETGLGFIISVYQGLLAEGTVARVISNLKLCRLLQENGYFGQSVSIIELPLTVDFTRIGTCAVRIIKYCVEEDATDGTG